MNFGARRFVFQNMRFIQYPESAKLNLFLAAPIALCLALCLVLPCSAAQTKKNHAHKKAVEKTLGKAKALHAAPWEFGQSSDRNSDLWQKGIGGNDIFRKAGIKIREAQKKHAAAEARPAEKRRSSLGLSMENESTTWQVSPLQKSLNPVEDMVRDRKHVLKAFADVQASDDLNISVGPELILKDEQYGEAGAKADQPDSAFGMGMNFKFDF